MRGPQSILEEVVRFQRIECLLLKSGLLGCLKEHELKELTDALIWADLDSYRDDWLDDVIKTVRWLSETSESESESESSHGWSELLFGAIRMQGNRLSCAYDDDEGESWKRV